MKLEFAYCPTMEDSIELAHITAVSGYATTKRVTWKYAVLYIPLFVFGIWITTLTPFPAFASIFLGALGGYVFELSRLKEQYWKSVYRTLDPPKGTIALSVTEEGMREISEGIESFAPWSAVTRYFVTDERILIELSSRLWAVVPARGLSPGSNALAELRDALAIHATGREHQMPRR